LMKLVMTPKAQMAGRTQVNIAQKIWVSIVGSWAIATVEFIFIFFLINRSVFF
jgi:hypothetical protein